MGSMLPMTRIEDFQRHSMQSTFGQPQTISSNEDNLLVPALDHPQAPGYLQPSVKTIDTMIDEIVADETMTRAFLNQTFS